MVANPQGFFVDLMNPQSDPRMSGSPGLFVDLMNPHDGLRLLYMIQRARPAEFEIVGCKLTPISQKENTMHVGINESSIVQLV